MCYRLAQVDAVKNGSICFFSSLQFFNSNMCKMISPAFDVLVQLLQWTVDDNPLRILE